MNDPLIPCATCRRPVEGRFCPHCGEKRMAAADHTLKSFFGQLFVAFTNVDGKVFLSLRCLLLEPGRLTADYLKGRRKPYIPPFELFLLANLFFFLLHPLIGSNTLTTDLNTHLHYTWHHGLAQGMVGPRLAARSLSVESYGLIFDAAAVTQAKTFLILIVPIFSLAVLTIYGRCQRKYAAHLVFSLHFCAFWLLLICATLALTNLTVRILRCIAVFPSAAAVSRGIILFTLVAMTLYLFRAVRTVFTRERGWITLLKAVALGLALDLSLQAYRFLLFFITFWST